MAPISSKVWLALLLVGQLQLAARWRHVYAAATTGDEQQSARGSGQQRNNGQQFQGEQQQQQQGAGGGGGQRCTRQSIGLARQMLLHELNYLNQFNAFWFSDADEAELMEGQKHSLSNIVMSGAGTALLNSNGQPLIEIESSYFRPGPPQGAANMVRLLRKHQDRCALEAGHFSYTVGLSLGPLEHNLDVVYNLPKELQLSQPIEWRYGQLAVSVPKMHYEVTFRQAADYRLAGPHGCPLEVSDVTYLASAANSLGVHRSRGQSGKLPAGGQAIAIASTGLAANNQTQLQVERLFDDYTRPAVSQRLRQMLKFYLNCKTFPLAAN